MSRFQTLGVPVLLSVGAFFVCLGLVLWCGNEFRDTPTGLRIDHETKSFGRVPAGSRLLIPFNLANPTGRTIHLLGGTSGCFPHGCLRPIGLPLEIPGHETREVAIEVETRDPGDFNGVVVLYSDLPGNPETGLTVKGLVAGFVTQPL